MNKFHIIELFTIKCAVIEAELRNSLSECGVTSRSGAVDLDDRLAPYIRQFSHENRTSAARMATYYEIFYMLENDIRRLISETLEASHGANWWDDVVPQAVREEVTKNKNRELQNAMSERSEEEIDYTTFGQLSDIIRVNWNDFAGMLSNQSAVSRVLSGLNMLRGTIAHCGNLADDEVDHLKLAIRDWFRVLEGPKN
jgi:hypothetical protein